MEAPKPIVEPTWVAKYGPDQVSYLVAAGIDKSGSVWYVARATHEGEEIPGKLHSRDGHVYISYKGEDIVKTEFEVLLAPPGSVGWIDDKTSKDSSLPILSNRFTNGKPVYIGRVYHKGVIRLGKVVRSEPFSYVAENGQEQTHKHYEVLTSTVYGSQLVIESIDL